ncbi:MAG: GNAT family N-acetyltransferase [Spirochaetales bacterium]|nr:GNAT family N-acetyltransferase [Spirochaetales bacterium]
MISLGTARRIITPPRRIYLVGYGDRKGGNTGVRDDLTATAMVWERGSLRAGVIAVDLLGINHRTAERVRAAVSRQVKLHSLEICCSHTHSGPMGWAPEKVGFFTLLKELFYRLLALPAGLSQPAGWRKNRKYIDFLVRSLTEAVCEASDKIEPVDLYAGEAPLFLGVNRRQRENGGAVVIGTNPQGPSPERVRVLQALSKKNSRSILTLVNYDCHGVFLGPESYAVSADWIGEMRGGVERDIPGYCAFLQGGSGNINPRGMQWGSGAEGPMVEGGKAAAEAVIRALEKKTPLPEIPGNGRSSGKTIFIPLETPEFAGGTSGKIYKRVLSKEAGMPRWIVDPLLHFRYPWGTEVVTGNDGIPRTPVRLSFLDLGAFSLATLSMEPFFETAENIRALLPGLGFFAGYTGDLTGYLPTADAAEEGGYEVDTSPFFYRLPGTLAKDAEDRVIEAFEALVAEPPVEPAAPRIRPARPEDKAQVAAICQKTFFGGPEFLCPRLVSLRWSDWYMEHSVEHCFVAVDEADRPVGYILCATDSDDYCRSFRKTMVPRIQEALARLKEESPATWRTYRKIFLPPLDEYRLPGMKSIIRTHPAHLHIDLLPDYQKIGLGGALMERLLAHLKALGIPGVHLIVGGGNHNAIGYYKRQGFTLLTRQGWGLEAGHVMGLPL